MRNVSTLYELLPDYEAAVELLRSKGKLTIEQGFDLVVALYQTVRVGAAIPGDANDEDMLLFQYGTSNWYDARGEYFGLDITRQVIVEEQGEPLIYQLAFEFEFDPAPFSACSSYNCWSTTIAALADWVSQQKATAGFQLAQARVFRNLVISVREV
jgi:hypothetical protein